MVFHDFDSDLRGFVLLFLSVCGFHACVCCGFVALLRCFFLDILGFCCFSGLRCFSGLLCFSGLCC